TRRDVIDHFGIDPARVTTTPLASALPLAEERPLDRPRHDADSVLFVGKRDGYKNFAGLLAAMNNPDTPAHLRLVAYGGGAFNSNELQMISGMGMTDRVLHVQPDDRVLDQLYQHALVYVCPSRYEGFGLPVLEAMERGCPVIIANAGSLPEIAGDAALRFSPDDIDGLSGHLVDLAEQPALRRQFAAAGVGQNSLFSWATTAKTTKAGYVAALDAAS
ncbi:MAG: glycosyltransferase family 4 protein, partial [Acidimicrobiia bacterium]